MSMKMVLIAGLLLTQPVAPNSEAYRFSRPVEWQDGEREELLAVPLDSRIYAATRDGFPDLRLVDQEGVETPYLLEKAVETRIETRRRVCNSRLLALKKKNNSIEIRLSLDNKAQSASGLTVLTPLTNFEHRVHIFASDDGKNWSLLVKDAEIFDYSSFMPASNRDIALPANAFRQFKVVIEEATEIRETELLELTRKLQQGKEVERHEKIQLQRVPLKIDRIEFWRTETEVLPETAKRFDYPVAGFKIQEDAKNQTTVIDVDTFREPLTGFRLQTSTRNFSRSAAVEIPETRGITTEMQTIGSAALESLHFQAIHRDHTTLEFPEHRQSNYRIIIRNNDNPPLVVTSVTGIGNGYHMLFLPQKGKSYRLHYGSEKAKSPVYETGPIEELLRKGYKSVGAVLGSASEAAGAPEALDVVAWLNSKLFLGFVVAVMVGVLAWSLVRLGKRIEQFPKE